MIGGLDIARWRDPVAFIETGLCNPETGQPFRLTPAEKRFVKHAFTFTEDGRLKYPELIFSGPKKSGKTCFAAFELVRMVPLETDLTIHACIENPPGADRTIIVTGMLALEGLGPLVTCSGEFRIVSQSHLERLTGPKTRFFPCCLIMTPARSGCGSMTTISEQNHCLSTRPSKPVSRRPDRIAGKSVARRQF
jgi:hypothetical protein